MRLFLAAAALYLIGCMASPKVQAYHHYAPTTTELDIYQTQAPARKYTEIGRIEVADTDDDYCMAKAQEEAHRLGADGLIILGRSGTATALLPLGAMAYADSDPYGIVAVAIRYTE